MRLPENEIMKVAKQEPSSHKLLLAYLGMFFLIGTVLGTATRMIYPEMNVLALLGNFFVTAIVFVLLVKKVGKRSYASLGMKREGLLRHFSFGFLIGGLGVTAVWLMNLLVGAIRVGYNPEFRLEVFFVLLVGFAFQSFLEEFLLRGVIFTHFAIKKGVLWAIIFNSVIFGIMHIGNPNTTFLGILNTVLVGVVFSLMYYYHDNIWMVSGVHAGWNFMLGAFYGVNVSGMEMPTNLLSMELIKGFDFIHGGGYGFESSFIASLVMGIGIAYYGYRIRKREK